MIKGAQPRPSALSNRAGARLRQCAGVATDGSPPSDSKSVSRAATLQAHILQYPGSSSLLAQRAEHAAPARCVSLLRQHTVRVQELRVLPSEVTDGRCRRPARPPFASCAALRELSTTHVGFESAGGLPRLRLRGHPCARHPFTLSRLTCADHSTAQGFPIRRQLRRASGDLS